MGCHVGFGRENSFTTRSVPISNIAIPTAELECKGRKSHRGNSLRVNPMGPETVAGWPSRVRATRPRKRPVTFRTSNVPFASGRTIPWEGPARKSSYESTLVGLEDADG